MIKEYKKIVKTMAVQYDGTNDTEINLFCGATKYNGDLIMNMGNIIININDWVVAEDTIFSVYKNKDFQKKFKKV